MSERPRRRGRSADVPIVLAVVGALLAVGPLPAQEPDTIASDTSSVSARHLRTALLMSGAYWVGGMAVMERVWYRDRERVPFHFFNDNGAYLQMDKAGHAFGAYVQSYVGYHWLRRAGLSRSSALLYGGGLGVILQTPIEVMDGIHEGWGFSWGDMAANVAGSALVVGQELLLGEQLIKYKFSYWGSEYAAMANGYLGTSTLERLLEDYNGHTYWLSVPLARLTPWDGVPRWLTAAVGYSANGMIGEFDNLSEFDGVAIPDVDRHRQLLLSLDVDWTKIETESPLLNSLFNGLTFVKLPFPALELSSRHGVRAYWMYY
jgi:uncharacterized protein YfiM (DUF2279 family)